MEVSYKYLVNKNVLVVEVPLHSLFFLDIDKMCMNQITNISLLCTCPL